MKNLSLKSKKIAKGLAAFLVVYCLSIVPLMASSHAEAPNTSMDRYADGTDVYAFRSYEAGRDGFVTLLANFIPFQDPSGGPQFYRFDDTVLYEIKIDNTGDGMEDIVYSFEFTTRIVRGDTAFGHTTVNQDGVVSNINDPDYNMPQTYTVRRNGVLFGPDLITTPPSNVGPRVTPDYENSLGRFGVHNNGRYRIFAGQREEGFFIDVGGVFDGLALRSIGMSGGVQTLQGFNVNTIAVEVPIQDLTRDGMIPASSTSNNAVVGVFSTASRRTTRVLNPNGTQSNTGNFVQISRLGNPLVNELIVPLNLKDAFNASSPTGDAVLAPTIQNPELPRLIQTIFGLYGPLGGPPVAINIPPPPRNDLVQIFATGIPAGAVPGLPNYTTVIQGTTGPHEYMRLNLAIAITPVGSQNRLGLLGGDAAGFPNGRRPIDDVVDIDLRAAVGGTPFTPMTNVAPNNTLGDGVSQNDVPFLTRFPYLASPHQGNQPKTSNFPAP
jgi:hypothetical protein